MFDKEKFYHQLKEEVKLLKADSNLRNFAFWSREKLIQLTEEYLDGSITILKTKYQNNQDIMHFIEGIKIFINTLYEELRKSPLPVNNSPQKIPLKIILN